MCSIGHHGHVEEEGLLEEVPHVVAGVDLLHLHLGVDVAVGQEVDVGVLDLGDGVSVHHHLDDVVQRQQRVALDLRVHILAHGAAGQQPDLDTTITEIKIPAALIIKIGCVRKM